MSEKPSREHLATTEGRLEVPDEKLPKPLRLYKWKGEKEYIEDEPESPEQKSGWNPNTFEVNGVRVRFYGVAHDADTLMYHGDELKEAINTASLVLVEGAPVAEKVLEKNKIKKLYEKVKKIVGYKNTDELVEELKADGFFVFYSAVERMAAHAGVPLVVADPEAEDYQKLGDLRQLDRTVKTGKLAVAISAVSTTIALGLWKRLNIKPTVSRRAFLKGAGALTLLGGTAGASSGADMLMDKGRTGGDIDYVAPDKNPLGPALYNLLDFRNIVASSGLVHLLKKHPELAKNVVVIYGRAHQDSIEYYSQHDIERSLRAELYRPYWTEVRPMLSLYTPDGAEHGDDGIQPIWKRIAHDKL